jgi:hypothetical protein
VRVDESGNQIGFLRQPDGRYVTIDPPGAAQTRRSASTTGGQVVGIYLDDDAVPGPDGLYPARSLYGYLWDRGRYQRLDVPGARATAAADINNRGHVVGDVKDADGGMRGFVRLRGRYRFVDGPGVGNTSFPIHVNDRGDMLIPAPGAIEGLVDLVERSRGSFARGRRVESARAAACAQRPNASRWASSVCGDGQRRGRRRGCSSTARRLARLQRGSPGPGAGA